MQRRKRTTDAGTGLLHIWLVCTLVLSTLTGLRFAVDLSESPTLWAIAPMLPVSTIWIIHILAGVSVMALAASYPLYLSLTGLSRRVTLDRARLMALLAPGKARWGALNVVLYWVLFACLAIQLATGIALFRGYGGWMVEVHLFVTWIIIGYAVAHVLTHFLFGGLPQLLRVLRPSAIPVPMVAAAAAAEHKPWSKRKVSPGAGILVLSACICVGVALGALFLRYDRMSRDVLQVARAPTSIKGLQTGLTDAVWRVPPLAVHTNQGMNLDGTGASTVEIRAVHDGEYIAMALSWDDPTRSLKHAPLIKREDGWHALFTPPEETRAHARIEKARFASETLKYYEDNLAEDKFAIMLAGVEKPFGPGAFHPGTKPLSGKPVSSSGRGMHYTEDGSAVNVWLWHADGGNSMRCENARVGGPRTPSSDQVRGLTPYKGGYWAPPEEQTVIENFTPQLPRDPNVTVTPVRLPRNPEIARAALGDTNFNPDYGDAEESRWWLTNENSEPFSAESDARMPVGTIIPGVIAPGPRPGGPRDVYCSAKWAAGRWTLLATRRLNTGQGDDIVIGGSTYMWVAAFDHTGADHTRHIRPIRLELK